MSHILVHHHRAPPPWTHKHARARGRVEKESLGVPFPFPLSVEIDQQRGEQRQAGRPVRDRIRRKTERQGDGKAGMTMRTRSRYVVREGR